MQLHSPFPPLPSGMKVSSINADTINVNNNSSRNLSGTLAFPSPELLQFQHTHTQGTSPWEIAGSLSKQPSLVCGHRAAACTRHPAAAPHWLSSQLQNYCRCASSPKPPHHTLLRGTDPKPPLSREINTSCKILAFNYQLLTASLTLQQTSFGKKKKNSSF